MMTKLQVEVKLTDVLDINTLLDLLVDNSDCITPSLMSAITGWANGGGVGWVSWRDIAPEFIDNNSCVVMLNGEEQQHVCGYNSVLKKVKVYNKKKNRIDVIKAKSFSINNVGAANFVGWT
jgi:hypothetical protein